MILNPDEHPERWTNPSEAFAHVARTLRDDVLPNPEVKRVLVMVGAPGSGKSTWAKAHDVPGDVVLDACHADAARRKALVRRIRVARKAPVAVWVRSPLKVALAQNAMRQRSVPRSKVLEQHEAIFRKPPNYSEGWDDIIVVVKP